MQKLRSSILIEYTLESFPLWLVASDDYCNGTELQ